MTLNWYWRIHWHDLLSFQAAGWRICGARVSHHSHFGPLMVKR